MSSEMEIESDKTQINQTLIGLDLYFRTFVKGIPKSAFFFFFFVLMWRDDGGGIVYLNFIHQSTINEFLSAD